MRVSRTEKARKMKKDRMPPLSNGGGRIAILRMLIVLGAVMIALRLVFLQAITHDKWVALADDQHQAFMQIDADRGEISMKDGDHTYPLAVNREYPTIYLVPKEVTDKNRVASELSRILGVDEGSILEKLDRTDDPFEIVKKRVSEDETAQVKALALPGIRFLSEKYRYYPAGELASQVVGFTNGGEETGKGGYGIESSENQVLRGEAGELSQEKDAAGRWIPLSDRDIVSAKPGEDIILTLDRVIQYETERILKDAVDKYGADRATAIVMDPKTGKILAMASTPQFDPNNFGQVDDYSLFLNPAVSTAYEPGSIMKPITMAIGLEEGKVSPESEYTDTGVIHEAGYDIHNADDKTYGKSSMIKVLDYSINTGVIYVEKLVGNAVFRDYMHRFGFGEKTGIELPAELPGTVRNLDNTRSDIQFFTASFGQGITTTPIQMITAYAALANGGTLMEPLIIDHIVHADGTTETIQPTPVRRVLSEKTSQEISRMLRDVVVNGHGKRADVPGYLVGGKTGTAQVAKSDAKGYSDSLSIGSFVGYAPVNDPKFVVLVKLDDPKNVEWAESSAAPAFGEIMKFLLEYAKVKPTEDLNKPATP